MDAIEETTRCLPQPTLGILLRKIVSVRRFAFLTAVV